MTLAIIPAVGRGGAVFSTDGLRRYVLWRSWGEGERVLFISLNPSTAGADEDDPTVRKDCGFARRWGFTGVTLVNLASSIATYAEDLATVVDPWGDDTDFHLRGQIAQHRVIVAAWGVPPGELYRERAIRVTMMANQHGPLHCIGRTAGGYPKHPSRAAYTSKPEVWG